MAIEVQFTNVNSTISLPNSKIQILGFYNYLSKGDAPKHTHHYYELHYITKGYTIFYTEFRDTVTVNSGEWLLLGPDVYHEEKTPHECSAICFGFEIQSVGPKTIAYDLSQVKCHKQSDSQNSILEIILKLIAAEYASKEKNHDFVCHELFSILFVHIQRQYQDGINAHISNETETDKSNSNLYIIDLFYNQIFDFGKMELTIDELAEKLHTSHRHVNRLLSKYYGCSFHEKLIETKMKYVEYLLLETDKTVGEISDICNMSATNLIRCFKKTHTITPLQYRKSYKKDML